MVGASCGRVASSSTTKEGSPAVEDIETHVATLLRDGETCHQYLKQFEAELLVERLLKVGDPVSTGSAV